MTVRRGEHGAILLEGPCPVEDAETLLSLLIAEPGAIVDWSACTRLHTSVVQVLLAVRPPIRGTCPDPFVGQWLAPQLPSGNPRSA
ncbi:MAG: hypothetical protein JWQ36_2360 [Enterovirga sp.]|nr:hypothetical protein [Enterovirga sp.]